VEKKVIYFMRRSKKWVACVVASRKDPSLRLCASLPVFLLAWVLDNNFTLPSSTALHADAGIDPVEASPPKLPSWQF